MIIFAVLISIIFCELVGENNDEEMIISETMGDHAFPHSTNIEEIEITDPRREEKELIIFDEDIECKEDIPNFMSYGHYTQKEISEAELREKIDPRIERNCKFCEYPLYEVNFNHEKKFYTRSDAFTGGYGEHVYLITNLPSTLRDSKKNWYKMKSEDYERAVLEVYPVCKEDNIFPNQSSPILIKLEELKISDRHLVMTFSIKEHPELLDTCFYILLRDEMTDHQYLTKPILVRHCHDEKRLSDDDNVVKRDQIAVCAMIYNKDRWMVEWIEWNMMMGTSHFYLYMHQKYTERSGQSEGHYDTTFSLLESYIQNGIVSVFLWNQTRDPTHWVRDQEAAYNDCLWRFRDRTEYLFLLDDDEFITPYLKQDALTVLNDLRREEEENGDDFPYSGYYIYRIDFSQDRLLSSGSDDSFLTTKMYRWLNYPKYTHPKLILITSRMFGITELHSVRVAETPKLIETTGSENGLFLSHYTERKYHDYNRIILEDEIDQFLEENVDLDRSLDWVSKRVQQFTDELETRVQKVIHLNSMFEYSNFQSIETMDRGDLPTCPFFYCSKYRWKEEIEDEERKIEVQRNQKKRISERVNKLRHRIKDEKKKSTRKKKMEKKRSGLKNL